MFMGNEIIQQVYFVAHIFKSMHTWVLQKASGETAVYWLRCSCHTSECLCLIPSFGS